MPGELRLRAPLRRAAPLFVVLALALGLAGVVARRQAGAPASALDEGDRLQRELERRALEARLEGRPPEGPLAVHPLDPQVARLFFPAIGKRLVHDPIVHALLRPDAAWPMHLPEHPLGSFELRTNALGLRGERMPAAESPALRVLVTGDSHVDGVVPNAETCASRLEARLAAAAPGRSVEVLNAGVGGYSFYNYLGVPERWQGLAPHVLVVCVYGGNDFAEAMLLERYFTRRGAHRTGPWSLAPLLHLEERGEPGGLVSQDLLQVRYFANNPEDRARSVEMALAISAELQRRCEARGVRLLFAYLPPATRAQPAEFADHARAARELGGFDAEQLAVSDGLADRWLAGLAERGIEHLDLRPHLAATPQPCYWRADLHLNTAGHQLLADLLAPRLAEL